MKDVIALFYMILAFYFSVSAQETIVKGRVVDTYSNEVIPDVTIKIEESIYAAVTNAEGIFSITAEELPKGEQVLNVEKNGYVSLRIPIIIEEGKTLDLNPVFLELDVTDMEAQIGIISLTDTQLDEDEGASFTISGLLQSTRDVFLSAAAYDFSTTFFRPRGYDSENGTVLINGIEMNKIFDGRPQWANWGGLNDVQRNQEFSMGISANDYTFGDLAGSTNIIMRASQYRKGGRISYAASNRSYRGRVMGSYHSGLTSKGWAYSFLISRRYGQEGFNEGTVYDANSFFASVEKKFSDAHSLNVSFLYTPNRRGKSSANTQEVIDLQGIDYNSFWGYQNGEIRNSRIKEVKEPIIMLNHYWNLSAKTTLNTNVGYQSGSIGNSRLGYDNAPNPDPAYYQYLPSYFLGNPEGPDLENAFRATRKFTEDGQINWKNLYETNILYGGTSRYYLYEDKNEDQQFSANTIVRSQLNEHITLNVALRYKKLVSENFAQIVDLLGGDGYLDVDTFNQGDSQQSDLDHPNRIIEEGDAFKYKYTMDAVVYKAFAQAQFIYRKIDFYAAANVGRKEYQRTGLYRNGSFPENSLGTSEALQFTTYGAKGGATYKITGRHLVDLNAGYFTQAPTIRNSFSNSRQNNDVVDGLTEERSAHLDVGYIYRSPIVKARVTGYYSQIQDAAEVSFYYADGISSTNRDVTTAFVQEVLTNVDKQYLGGEMGVEAQLTTTFKLKGAAAFGQYTYANNPTLYITSDDQIATSENPNRLELGTAYLKNYRIAGGPQQAYQLGFEYRDPDFWWVGATCNYFSQAFVDIAPITRTQNFYLDTDQIPFNDYDPAVARELLQQEQFDAYSLVNIIGGKSWKVKKYYIGFFATVGNVFNTTYKTGGFEQGRNANYRELAADTANNPRVFGNKYWYGYGTTYYVNLYVRF